MCILSSSSCIFEIKHVVGLYTERICKKKILFNNRQAKFDKLPEIDYLSVSNSIEPLVDGICQVLPIQKFVKSSEPEYKKIQ